MNGIEADRERGRLEAMYREMSDGEIEEMGASAGDLTDLAQEALEEELRRRGLRVWAAGGGSEEGEGFEEGESFEEGEGRDEGNESSGWKTLHVFHQTFEAQAAFRLMEREEIEFRVEDRTLGSGGGPGARAAVQLALLVDSPD